MPTLYGSGCLAGLSLQMNAQRNLAARAAVVNMVNRAVEPMLGCYDGVPEYSFKVELESVQIYSVSQLLFKKFGQEAVLIVGDDGQAHLRMADGSVCGMGALLPAGPKMPAGDWSFDGVQFWQLG